MTSSTPDYPDYQFVPTVINSNGETLASQYKDASGTVITNINSPSSDTARKTKLQNLLDEYESSVNIFSPEFNSQIESIANAKKESALKSFNSIYEPAARSTREDYFSRLGTLDSTAYLDKYNDLEKTRQQAYADIANDYVANLDELKNNELTRRYTYLNYLQNGLNSLDTQSTNYLNAINSLSSNYTNSYNSYLSSLYNSQKNSSNSNNWSNLLNTMTSIFI